MAHAAFLDLAFALGGATRTRHYTTITFGEAHAMRAATIERWEAGSNGLSGNPHMREFGHPTPVITPSLPPSRGRH
jgi:hypothetical protein